MRAMRIAAVDMGSNSLHMVIVDVARSGGFQVIDRVKDMVRLGSALPEGHIPEPVIRQALNVLKGYSGLAATRGVDKILAVATSAIREADNGGDFLKRVGRETRIWARAISGEEEARLIYLAVHNSVRLEGKRALLVDIGGGSVEIAVGSAGKIELAASEKLGVLRLKELHGRHDPLSPGEERRIEEQVARAISPHARAIRRLGFRHAVGTSGTILALGALARTAETGRRPESLHHVVVKAETIADLRRRLTRLDLRARTRLPGLDPDRADVLHIGAVLLDTLLTQMKVRELLLCEWALREGLLLDYIQSHPRTLARAEAYPDVRRRSVVELAERCLYDEPHARHVCATATALFDATRRLHRLGNEDRAILEHASLLHDIGHHISHNRHHIHTGYLILNGGLRGFDPQEIDLIANVARYHRRALPRRKHPSFGSLTGAFRRKARLLAGMLRVADGLDRSHRQHVRPVAIRCNPTGLRILVRAQGDGELEIWEARRRAMLLETCLGRSVTIETMAPGRRAGVAGPVPGASGKRAATGRAPAPPSR